MFNSLNEYKEYLGVDLTDLSNDVYLQKEADNLEAEIVTYLGRDITADDYVEIYDGDGTDELQLNQVDISSLDALSIDEDPI
jgi:hypothetical protein